MGAADGMKAKIDWEEMDSSAPLKTWRAPVPGGWIVVTITSTNQGPAMAQSFVADTGHSWIRMDQ